MANEKFTVVGTNIQEKATVIWNVANHLFGYFTELKVEVGKLQQQGQSEFQLPADAYAAGSYRQRCGS